MLFGVTIQDLAAAVRGPAEVSDPDELYVRDMARDFGLSTRQQQQLFVVMQRYRDEELQVFRNANFDQLPESLRAELTSARRRRGERIRAMLDDEQRKLFEDRSRTGSSAR